MKNSIKVSLFASALLVSAAAVAAPTAATSGTAMGGSAAGTSWSVTGGTAGTCPMLQENIVFALSANVGGGFTCTVAGVAIGTANSKGRGMIYTVTSAGGDSIRETSHAKFTTQADADSAANTEAGTVHAATSF